MKLPCFFCSIYFYDRTTYIVIIAEPHMKPVSDVANIGTGVLMGYKVFHFCDLTDPPKGL